MAKTITVEVTKKKLPLTNIYVIGSSNQRLALLKVPDVTSFLKNLEYEQF